MIEKDIEILMKDGCTREEAEKHLSLGTVVFDERDFRDNFSNYMEEWGVEDGDQQPYREMLGKKKPLPDWGVVEYKDAVYFIEYVL